MGRPNKALISRESAARAALDIIDEEGLRGVNLELVARKLGVKAPSLYYHFKDKSALLAEVALCILRDVRPRINRNMRWEESIIRVAVASRREILCHPNAAPLLLEHLPKHIFIETYDFWASLCPYPDEIKMTIMEAMDKLMFGSALFAAAALSKGKSELPDFDHRQFPHIGAAADANLHDDEEQFVECVTVFLAGLRHYAERDHTWPETLTSAVQKASE